MTPPSLCACTSTPARDRAPAASSRRARAAGARVAALASAPRRVQHFLADRHADAFLELEAHQRHRTVEDVRRLVDLARRGRARRSLTSISGNAKPVITPVAPAISSSSRNTPPRPPKIATFVSPAAVEDARRLERRRRILELDRPRARDLARDAREQRRLHREAGDRRIVLHDDRRFDRVGQRLVVATTASELSLGMRGGLTITAAAPSAFACRRVRDARPRAFGRRCRRRRRRGRRPGSTTVSSTRRRSRSSAAATSPVTPSAVMPFTPAFDEQIDDARRLSSSTSPAP